jgi:hypothetical protein
MKTPLDHDKDHGFTICQRWQCGNAQLIASKHPSQVCFQLPSMEYQPGKRGIVCDQWY